MSDTERQYVYTEDSYSDYHEVEVSVVAFTHAVANPRAMVIKPLWKEDIVSHGIKRLHYPEENATQFVLVKRAIAYQTWI